MIMGKIRKSSQLDGKDKFGEQVGSFPTKFLKRGLISAPGFSGSVHNYHHRLPESFLKVSQTAAGQFSRDSQAVQMIIIVIIIWSTVN